MSLDIVMERITARVAAIDPNGPRNVLGVFALYVMMGSAMEPWVVDLKELKVEQGVADFPDVSLTMALEDLVAISDKTISVDDALKQGKIEVAGDSALASKLAEVI